MIDILFFPDFEIGHVYPTFKLAQNLEEQGYVVAYMGNAATMKVVEKAGFKTYPIFEEEYPEGFKLTGPAEQQKHILPLVSGSLDSLLLRLNPGVIISSCFNFLEVLILTYRNDYNHMIYLSHLPELKRLREYPVMDMAKLSVDICSELIFKLEPDVSIGFIKYLKEKEIEFTNFKDIARPLEKMQHLLFCPNELDFPILFDKKILYTEPNIRTTEPMSEEEIRKFLPEDKDKKIIYCSLGSQISRYVSPEEVFDLAIECMEKAEFTDYHMIMSVGKDYTPRYLPDNVSIHKWTPQIDLLKRASLAIIHGGLGSIKECIYYGVPMLAIPMGRDQFDNAKRIIKHRLGLTLQKNDLTKESMSHKMNDLLSNDTIHYGIRKMQKVFQEKEAEQPGVNAIRQALQHTVGQANAV